MKPYKSFIFLVLILIFALGVLALIMPDRFSEILSVRFAGSVSFAGASSKETEIEKKDFLAELKRKDSIIADINARYSLNPQIFGQSDLANIPLEPFIYDTSGAVPLESVYRSLLDLQQNPMLLRFLHYGDSQIENDRITSTFRLLLQRAFGGSGCGTLPLFQSDYQGRLSIKLSKNWSVMSMRTNQRRGNYGLCNAYLYPPAINAIMAQKNVENGNVQIGRIDGGSNNGSSSGSNGGSGGSGGSGNNGSNSGSSEIFVDALLHEDIWVEKDLYIDATAAAAENKTSATSQSNTTNGSTNNNPIKLPLTKQENSFGLQHCRWKLPSNTESINLSLRLLKNRNIYAISINGNAGVVVDNLAMRGSIGNIFLKNNRRFLMDNYSLMNVRLVIYQFGINALPNKPVSEKEFAFYEKMLRQELGYLRITVPDVPIIVVGLSDRSYKNGLLYMTNSNVYTIRKIQRKVALENACVFWDLFSAMGGENSMQDWATANSAVCTAQGGLLGGKDFVHFTDRGADYVGKMLFKAFLDDYRKFVIREKQREILSL